MYREWWPGPAGQIYGRLRGLEGMGQPRGGEGSKLLQSSVGALMRASTKV